MSIRSVLVAVAFVPACTSSSSGSDTDAADAVHDSATSDAVIGDGASSPDAEHPDAAGKNLPWITRLESNGPVEVLAIAAASAGNVVVVGRFGSAPLDVGELTTAAPSPVGTYDAFVLRLSADGTPIWLRSIRGTGLELFDAVDVGPDDMTYLAGRFGGTVMIDDIVSYTSVGFADAIVLALDGAGEIVWSRRFPGPQAEQAMDVAVQGDRVFVTGTAQGAEPGVDLGGGMLPYNMFVGALDRVDGEHLWSRGVLTSYEELPLHLRVVGLSAGDAVVCGEAHGAVDAGGGLLIGHATNLLMARFDGDDGAHVWSVHEGVETRPGINDRGINLFDLMLADDETLVVVGSAENNRDFGGGDIIAPDGWYPFVARYSDSGAHVSSGVWPSLNAGTFAVVDGLPGDDLLVAGRIDVASRTFFARVTPSVGTPDWVPAWSWSSPGTGFLEVQAAAVVDEICVVGGHFGMSIHVGGTTLTESGSDTDGFVAARACEGP